MKRIFSMLSLKKWLLRSSLFAGGILPCLLTGCHVPSYNRLDKCATIIPARFLPPTARSYASTSWCK